MGGNFRMKIIIPNPLAKNFVPISGLKQYIINLRSHDDHTLNAVAQELEDLFVEIDTDDLQGVLEFVKRYSK